MYPYVAFLYLLYSFRPYCVLLLKANVHFCDEISDVCH